MPRDSQVQVVSRPRKRQAPASRLQLQSDGVLPALQERSRASRAALITTGIRLLEKRDYKSFSIAELTAANGLSIGAFYARFAGKEAYFSEMQRQVFEEVQARARALLAPERWASQPAQGLVEAFVGFFVDLVRKHRGFLAAALRHEASNPSAWVPSRNAGAAMAALFAQVLRPKLEGMPRRERDARIGFAVQILYGTIINTVLHEPGPVRLHDKRLAPELAKAMTRYLGLADERAKGRPRKASGRPAGTLRNSG